MNVDVAAASELLDATLRSAVEAAREHTAAQNAIAVEELTAWEQIGALLVPAFTPGALADAAKVVGDPEGLASLVPQHEKTRADLASSRAVVEAGVLDAVDLDELTERRARLNARVGIDKARLKELRQRPGLLDRLDDLKRGLRLKDDVMVHVRAHEELRANVDAVEAELSRLAAASARHHRARKRVAEIDDQLSAADEAFLRDARRIAVDRLMSGAARPTTPSYAALFRVVDGIAAKRECLAYIYDTWVRPGGNALLALQAEGKTVSGFETISWPAKVELCCRETSASLDAWRRHVRGIVEFAAWGSVVGNAWWRALLPGVPQPGRAVPEPVFAARDVADVAGDKLAAAWASLSQPEGTPVDEFNEPTDAVPSSLFNLMPGMSGTFAAPQNGQRAIPGFDDEQANPFAEPSREVTAVSAVTHVELMRASFSAGSRVGRCVVEELIGKGGMGEVYRGSLIGEGGFTRPVVLKRITGERYGDDDVGRAFAREAEIAARIAHPNVVQIFDVQAAGKERFIVMELLEGLSLQKLAARARREEITLSVPVMTRCFVDAARGLHAAHSFRGDDGTLVGLVHRDVSPDNLFLCQNGFTKLLDFGIARRNDLRTMTGKNELKGKIPYMSPEQITGDQMDARSDLFSLGSTIYWIMTGVRPFVGDSDINTLYAVVNKQHPPLKALRPDALALSGVVELLLQKRRDDRPPSALAVVQALEACGPASPEEAAAFLARIP